VLIIDEIGLLEINKQGWFPLMNLMKQSGKKPLIIASVRKNILVDIKLFFGSPGITVYDLDTMDSEKIIGFISRN
jgi:hypothetical protein